MRQELHGKRKSHQASAPRKFWSYLKNRLRSGGDIPCTVIWNDITASTGMEIENLFATVIKSIYNELQESSPTTEFNDNCEYSDAEIS